MPDIINKTDQIILLRFNSGLTRHLAPREVLKNVEHVEVKGNARIKHLEQQHIIAVKRPTEERPEASARRRSSAMRAEEAIEHIQNTPLEELQEFLSPDEDRVTVLRAMEERRGE